MTREEFYDSCLEKLSRTRCLIAEAATGYGKSKVSIDLVNLLCATKYQGKKTKMLLLVAKKAHKITWRKEFEKWGGIHVDELVIECFDSLHKHYMEHFDFVVIDEVHHLKSDLRIERFSTITFDYMIGLSATIPRTLKAYLRNKYKAEIVSCDLVEAIGENILPEPQILLFPLELDNTKNTETVEVNPKAKGNIARGVYRELWKYKKQKVHAILSCTQKQRSNEYNTQVLFWKNQFNKTRNEAVKQIWMHLCLKRLEFYSDIKIPVVKQILEKIKDFRSITFCKTIDQCEQLGQWCIHSKNGNAEKYYNDFNERKIDHITAVNILNENANLVDCKYAIFANLSGSDTVQIQRMGRSLRHKSPVIIVPYYRGTREEEIVNKMFFGDSNADGVSKEGKVTASGFFSEYIKVIHSISEI